LLIEFAPTETEFERFDRPEQEISGKITSAGVIAAAADLGCREL
jgi:hypothetical protein